MSAPLTQTPPSREESLAWRRLQTEVMLGFSRVHQQVLRRSTQILDEAGLEGLTPARANALIVLFNARRPINARELANELGISEVTVSRFIRKMEDDGWVERTPDPTDGRARLLQLTRQARQQFPQLVRVSNRLLDDVFGEMTPEELARMARTFEEVQARLTDRSQG